jgi:hypothetical protein
MANDDRTLCIDPVLGALMTVRVAWPGETLALSPKKPPACESGDPLVEFYDRSFQSEPGFAPYGQFIGRYCASWIRRLPAGKLILNSRVPQWAVDASTVECVRGWLETQLAGAAA